MSVFKPIIKQILPTLYPLPGDESWDEKDRSDGRVCLDCGASTDVVQSGTVVEYDVCQTESCENGGKYKFARSGFLTAIGFAVFLAVFLGMVAEGHPIGGMLVGLCVSLAVMSQDSTIAGFIAEVSS